MSNLLPVLHTKIDLSKIDPNATINKDKIDFFKGLHTGPKLLGNLLSKSLEAKTGLAVTIALDITHSMDPTREAAIESLIDVVKNIQNLQDDNRNLNTQISVIGYRNEGDRANYGDVMEYFGFSDATQAVANLRKITRGGGGPDWLCSLECVFRRINQEGWPPRSEKVLIMVGDMPPHGAGAPGDQGCRAEPPADWRREIQILAAQYVKAHTVFCSHGQDHQELTRSVYQEISRETGGKFFEFADIAKLKEDFAFLITAILAESTKKLQKLIGTIDLKALPPSKQAVITALLEGPK